MQALAEIPSTQPRTVTDTLLLDIRDLSIGFRSATSTHHSVVREVSLQLRRSRILALVGESGSGKTMVARAIMGLLPPGARVTTGCIDFDGEDVLRMPVPRLRALRGRRIGMVFQEPMVSLNPALTVGFQLAEALRLHTKLDDQQIRQASVDMLRRVRIHDPEGCLRSYPHQFSGGMRQRIMLASVMLLRPDVLLADEPTSALDSIVQQEVLEIMFEVTRTFGTTVLLITHDLALAAQYADTVAVMCRGVLKEVGPAKQILGQPRDSYTRMLLESLPERQQEHHGSGDVAREPLIEIDRVSVEFIGKRRWPWERALRLRAVDDVSLTVMRGETLALVGESGSGKTTLGRALVREVPVASGVIDYAGVDITIADSAQLYALRRKMQFVFQDPYSSLDPRMRVEAIVAQGLRHVPGLRAEQIRSTVNRILRDVGLDETHARRFPHELSGGQRQRVCIARAIAISPEFLIADEPVAALDVTVQAQILKMFAQLKQSYGFTLLFVSHDLAVVEQIADRIAVMNCGRVVEQGPALAVMRSPRHPYTRQLVTLRPRLERADSGEYSLVAKAAPEVAPPAGCQYALPVRDRHSTALASMVEVAPGHFVLCESAHA